MFIKELKLHNFRNLCAAKLDLSPGVNFITGQNAQGKTNLIEAINLLSFARSFRAQSAQELVRWGEKACAVFALIRQADCEFEAGISIENGEKQVFLNGDRLAAISDYIGRVLCVSFTPDDLQLVKGAPAERRRFMDRHISEAYPSFVNTLVNYNRALKSKSKLISSGRANYAAVRPWNLILARSSLEIINRRRAFLRKIEERLNSIHGRFAPEDGELELQLKTNLEDCGVEPDISSLESIFDEYAQREIEGGACFLGVHRDDVLILNNGRDMRTFGSQGQARSITLSLKMAVVEFLEEVCRETPIVLLDDLDSELDRERRERLFEMVLAQERQVFITGTELRMNPERCNGKHVLIEVVKGSIRELPAA